MYTMRRQWSRIAAFLLADARPMFCWPRSAATARSQVWLPNGRFQSGGSLRITAATAWWWSSCGELRAICPKSRNYLNEHYALISTDARYTPHSPHLLKGTRRFQSFRYSASLISCATQPQVWMASRHGSLDLLRP